MGVKISELPADSALTGAEQVPLVQSSATKRSTITEISNFVRAFFSASGGSALVGFLQAGTGAVARTTQAKARDVVSIMDFGATGDGATDDSVAVQAALTYMATLGGAVYAPTPAVNYYMGSTGITIGGNVRLFGTRTTPFVWAAGFNGTAVTLTGSYAVLEEVILFKPKSVAAPTNTIIAVDMQHPLSACRRVRVDQTTAGNNSGWYTGIKISGASSISCTLDECESYAYDIAYLYSGSGSLNDLTLHNCIGTSQATAVLKTINASSVQVWGGDLEGHGSTYAVWLNTTTAEGAGCSITGTYIQGGSDSCIFADANASFPIRGLAITGCEVNGALVATSAVRLSNTNGVSITGSYLVGVTNYLKLENTNSLVLERGNYKVGALLASGTYTLDNYATASFTTTLTGVTAAVTGTGYYTINGSAVVLDLPELTGTSNTTSKSYTGIPAAARPTTTKNVAIAAIDNTGTRVMSIGTISSSGVLTCYPTAGGVSTGWTAGGTCLVSPMSVSYTLN